MIEAIRNVTAKGSGPNAGKKVQNLIIVGTRRWSQELIEATGSNSIGNEDNKNIAYGFHFYAGGSHPCNGGPANVYSGHPLCASTDNWQITMEDQLKGAMNNNKAVFVTEWGTVGSSGNNAHNANSSDAWHKLLDQYKISSCAWQWGGKDETSAFFLDKAAWNKPPTTPNQPESWFGVKSNFSESGQYIFQMLQNWANVASWRQSNACGDCEPIAVIYKYNYAGAPADGTSTACKGQKVSEPAKPTRAGYQFSGWFTADEGGEEFNFDTEITTATTIYAQWSEGEGSTMIADCKSDKTNLCTTWWSYLDKEAGGSTLTAVGGTDEDEDGNISLKVSENGGFNNGPCMSVNFASPAQGAWPNADYSIWGAGLGFNLDAASTEKVPVVVDLTNAISISFRYDTDANSISNKKNFIELKVNGRAENLIAEIIPPTTKWGVVDIPFESFATSQYAEIEEPSDPINATDMKNIIAIQFKIEAEEAAKSISMGISDIQINGKDLSAITNTCKGDGVGVATIENVSFAIYPNPAKAGNFNVTLADSDAANLTILNLQGQVVYSAAVNNGAAAINANLGVGVYVVSVQTANGVQTQKLVVK